MLKLTRQCFSFPCITCLLLFFFFFLTESKSYAQFSVVEFTPSSHIMVSANSLNIVIEFDEPVATGSVTERSFSVFGRWTGVCPGDVFFENDNRTIRFIPTRSISAGEWVTVSLSKEILSASGESLVTGYAWNFWTRTAPGTLDLEETATIPVRRPGEGPIRTYGAYAGDLNGDGFHDFTVPNEDVSDVRVFMNDGLGGYSMFSTFALPANSVPSTNEGADFNGDGRLDFACGNIIGSSVTVFNGDGTGAFSSQRTYPVGNGQGVAGTRGLAVLDLNCDGWTDIVTANRGHNNISKLVNLGNGLFAPSVQQNSGTTDETACAAADFNEDGIMDIVVGSFKNGGSSGDMVLMLSDGNGNLTRSELVNAGGASWMVAVGDMNGDRHVDVVSANSTFNNFSVMFGDGSGNLSSATTYETGGFPLAIDVGDLDGDGDLDVVTSNFNTSDWTIYENDGNGQFGNRRTLRTTNAGSCAVLHDRDRDGDLDMTGIDELDDNLILFSNPATPTTVDPPPIAINFELYQSYPNPFSLSNTVGTEDITISFNLQQAAEVKIDLLNIRGQRVAVGRRTSYQPGTQSVTFTPRDLAPGVYFYRLTSGSIELTRKILLLK